MCVPAAPAYAGRALSSEARRAASTERTTIAIASSSAATVQNRASPPAIAPHRCHCSSDPGPIADQPDPISSQARAGL